MNKLIHSLLLLVFVVGLMPASAAVTSAAVPACTELIGNGNMEVANAWVLNRDAFTPSYDTAQAHSFTRSLRLGVISGANAAGSSSVSQTIAIPATADTAKLNWWAWTRQESSGDNDFQEASLIDAATGNTLAVLWREQRNDRAWVNLAQDLTAYRGRTVRLVFNVRNDGADSFAGMYLDDVSLLACENDGSVAPAAGGISGLVYEDGNRNGLRDSGEIGLANVQVSLSNSTWQFTDTNGAYNFTALPNGIYSVSVTPPSGYSSTSLGSVSVNLTGSPATVDFGVAPTPTATPTLGPIVVTNTPTPGPIIVTATPTPIVVTNTPTLGPIVVTNTPTLGPIIVTATPTPIVVTNTPTLGPIVVTNTPTLGPIIWTATPTATPVGSATPTPTVTPLPPTSTPPPTATPLPAGCTNWLENSGFEEELQLIDPGWVIYPVPLLPTRVNDPKLSGNWSVRLGTKGVDAASFSSVRQWVDIPINATSAELKWHWWAGSDNPGDQGDYQQALLLTPSENPRRQQLVRDLWPRNRETSDSWKEGAADLMRHRGMTVVIYFNVYNDGDGKRRWMYLDDMSLTVCVPAPAPQPQAAVSPTVGVAAPVTTTSTSPITSSIQITNNTNNNVNIAGERVPESVTPQPATPTRAPNNALPFLLIGGGIILIAGATFVIMRRVTRRP